MADTAAQHTDHVVVAHGEGAFLFLVEAHQAKVDITLHLLMQRVQAHSWVVLGHTLYVLRLGTDLFPSSPDALICFGVSSLPVRGGVVCIKPLCPLAFGLAGGGGHGAADSGCGRAGC